MPDTIPTVDGLAVLDRLRTGGGCLTDAEAAALIAHVEATEAALAEAQDALAFTYHRAERASRGIARGFPAPQVQADVQEIQRRVASFTYGATTGQIVALLVRGREFRLLGRLLTHHVNAKHPAGIQEAVEHAFGHARDAEKDAARLLQQAALPAKEVAHA